MHSARACCYLIGITVVLAVSPACGPRTPPKVPGADAPATAGGRSISSELLSAVVESALALQGTPYRNGGAAPPGFDCSGLVQYVFAEHGIRLPRSSRDQFDRTTAVPRDSLSPGDLVFFQTAGHGPSHVGIVIDADRFVHAPSGNGVVRVEHLSAEYWSRRFVGVRRVRTE